MLDPARGCSSTTMPSLPAFVVGRLRTTTRNPAERRLDAAVAWSWPTTFGTEVAGCGFGPAETTSGTREPRRSVVPGVADYDRTRFAGWDERR